MENTAIKIVKTFQDAGFEAYFAGGSVRDMLMGHDPQDYDIATSATPDEIEKIVDGMYLGSRTIPIGKKFGVILGIVHNHEFEIATFRSDSSSSDGRRPDAVTFTNPKQDAVRRDFTINGLFYNPIKKEVLDFVGGQKDIQNKIIRFIGEPHERIKEDHLRLLRAVRFKNNFEFEYDKETEKSIQELAYFAQDISSERIQSELTKMIMHPRRSHSFSELHKLGILKSVLPEVSNCEGIKQPIQYHQEGDVLTHLFKSLHDIPEDWVNKELAWGVLLHDIGKPDTFKRRDDRIHFDGHALLSAKMAGKLLRRLKFPNIEISKIVWIIEHHMSIGLIPDMRRAHKVNYYFNPWFEDLMRLHYCDEHGSLPIDLSLYEKIMKEYNEFKNEKFLEDHFKPELNGHDLMREFGIKPGPKIQEILESLREERIEGKIKTVEDEKEWVKNTLNT